MVGDEGDVGELTEGVAAARCSPGGVAEVGEEAADGFLRLPGGGRISAAGRAGGVELSAAAAWSGAVPGPVGEKTAGGLAPAARAVARQ